jgi:subtilisin family serine protease
MGPKIRGHSLSSRGKAAPLAGLLLAMALLMAPPVRPTHAGAVDLGCLDEEIPRWGLDRVQARQAQTFTRGEPSVVVAIIDSGVDFGHPDLSGHQWTNPGEIPGNGIDDDGNGFIDDVNGYNFAGPRGDDVSDTFGHGTFVASIVASVAPNVRLMAVRQSPGGVAIAPQRVANAVRYAVDNGASVINISSGSVFPSRVVADALAYAVSRDVLVVLSAGNDDSNSSGAAYYPQTMAVAATDARDRLTLFTNYGTYIDVAAPGFDIYGALPGGGFGVCDGTSFSAPFVSGTGALLRSANPALRVPQLIERIDLSADNINAVNPDFRGTLNFGRLNAYRALSGAVSNLPPLNGGGPTAGVSTGGSAGRGAIGTAIDVLSGGH